MSNSLVMPWRVAPQAPLSMGLFPRQEYWSVYHFLLQGIFLTQGSDSCLLHWQVDSLLLSHEGSPQNIINHWVGIEPVFSLLYAISTKAPAIVSQSLSGCLGFTFSNIVCLLYVIFSYTDYFVMSINVKKPHFRTADRPA